MAVGDIERLVEGLVNRGLVSPKMVGRTVGQATIEELKNLGGNIAQSQGTLQNEQQKQLSELQRKIILNSRNFSSRSGRTNDSISSLVNDINSPFIVGQTKGSLTEPSKNLLAVASNGGYKISPVALAPATLATEGISNQNQTVLQNALKNTKNKNLPFVQGSSFLNTSQTYRTIQELLSAIGTGLNS